MKTPHRIRGGAGSRDGELVVCTLLRLRYLDSSHISAKDGDPLTSAGRHFLRHVQQEPAIAIIHATHQPAELVEKARLFAVTSPYNVVGAFALLEGCASRRLFAIVKKLMWADFESTRHFFEGLNGRYGMAIFNSGNVATE